MGKIIKAHQNYSTRQQSALPILGLSGGVLQPPSGPQLTHEIELKPIETQSLAYLLRKCVIAGRDRVGAQPAPPRQRVSNPAECRAEAEFGKA